MNMLVFLICFRSLVLVSQVPNSPNSVMPRINITSYDAIHPGMTEREVRRILGAEPGFHFTGVVVFRADCACHPAMEYFGTKENKQTLPLIFRIPVAAGQQTKLVRKGWIGDEIGIWLTFEDGVVAYKAKHFVKRLNR